MSNKERTVVTTPISRTVPYFVAPFRQAWADNPVPWDEWNDGVYERFVADVLSEKENADAK
jgi:hypothetical protein